MSSNIASFTMKAGLENTSVLLNLVNKLQKLFIIDADSQLSTSFFLFHCFCNNDRDFYFVHKTN